MLCFGRSEAVLIVARVLQGISAAVVWTVGIAPCLGGSGLTRRTGVDRRHGSRGTSGSSYGICIFRNVNWSYSWSCSRWDRLRPVRVLCGIWSCVCLHWIGLGITGHTCGKEDCSSICRAVSYGRRRESRVCEVAAFARGNTHCPGDSRGANSRPSDVPCAQQSAESSPSDYPHPQISSSSCGSFSVLCSGFDSLRI